MTGCVTTGCRRPVRPWPDGRGDQHRGRLHDNGPQTARAAVAYCRRVDTLAGHRTDRLAWPSAGRMRSRPASGLRAADGSRGRGQTDEVVARLRDRKRRGQGCRHGKDGEVHNNGAGATRWRGRRGRGNAGNGSIFGKGEGAEATDERA